MNYQLIDILDYESFLESTPEQAEDYFTWFIEAIPQRIEMLQAFVNETEPQWKADKTPESLIALGLWFSQQLGTQPPVGKLKKLVKDPDTTRWIEITVEEKLTDFSYSLIIDMGMYLGEVFRNTFQNLEWTLYMEDTVNYHQPVISPFKTKLPGMFMECNPITLTKVFALKLLKKDTPTDNLFNIYEYWAVYA